MLLYRRKWSSCKNRVRGFSVVFMQRLRDSPRGFEVREGYGSTCKITRLGVADARRLLEVGPCTSERELAEALEERQNEVRRQLTRRERGEKNQMAERENKGGKID